MEEYQNAENKGSVILLVETTGLPAAELQAWAKKFDLKKLAEVK
jgi:hypothetical protein